MKWCFFYSSVFISLSSFAQHETDWWYFGANAGIHFLNDSPVAVTNGRLNTVEGCSSISDIYGNLMFYTDGITVYNNTHDTMENGVGLGGHFSSSQSALIIPFPGTFSLYYIFTVDAFCGSNGLQYAIVNMSCNHGRGKVMSKNNRLLASATEKLTAIPTADSLGYWIIAHECKTDTFYSYKITSQGIYEHPVKTGVGSPHGHWWDLGNQAVGCMKPSRNGEALAVSQWNDSFFEVFNFDRRTGIMGDCRRIDGPVYPFGLEFSPNGRFLYLSANTTDLYQYDLITGDQEQIKKSAKVIERDASTYLGELQMASNGKIYFSKYNKGYLGCLNHPDSIFPYCGYNEHQVDLEGGMTQEGLPNYVSYYTPKLDVSFTYPCENSLTAFYLPESFSPDSLFWDFGDLKSVDNTSVLKNPTHRYGISATYRVSLTYWFYGEKHTFWNWIEIITPPHTTIYANSTNCKGDSLRLEIRKAELTSYKWNSNNSDTLGYIYIRSAGFYYVDAENECGITRDSFRLDIPGLHLGEDIWVCDSVSLTLNPQNDTFDFIWSNGQMAPSICINEPGWYWAMSKNLCGVRDSIYVGIIKRPDSLNLGNDTTICPGQFLFLTLPFDGWKHQWDKGGIEDTLRVHEPGVYFVKVYNLHCTYFDSIIIYNYPVIQESLYDDTAFCFASNERYYVYPITWFKWGIPVEDSLEISGPGAYKSYFMDTNGCRQVSSFLVQDICEPQFWIPNAFSPGVKDTLNRYFRPTTVYVDFYILRVYNRWGDEIYTGNETSVGWDGTFRDTPCQQDVYIWKIEYNEIKSKNRRQSKAVEGVVHLLR